MYSVTTWNRILALTFIFFWAVSHSIVFAGAKAPLSSAEKIRKSLDQVLTFDYSGNSLPDVIQHLQERTQVRFLVDPLALQSVVPILEENQNMIHIKNDGSRVRQTLHRFLTPLHLTYVVMEDSVLITTDEMGMTHQLRQRIPVDVADLPVSKALRDLARQSGVNVLVDPRLTKETQTPITLQLEDATLETTIRLMAEIGGLKAVRVGNVVFVTNEERANRLRRDDPLIPGMGAYPDMPQPAVPLGNAGIGAVRGVPLEKQPNAVPPEAPVPPPAPVITPIPPVAPPAPPNE